MKYIIEYCGQTAMVSNVEESINAIQSFHSYGRKNNPFLQVNSHVLSALTELFDKGEFNGHRFPMLRTTGCGCKDIRFFEALGDTLEEHEENYRAKCEAEKAERIRLAKETKQRLLAEFNEVRRGWYRVEVEIEAHDMFSMRPKHFISSGYGIANSKMDAYGKFVNDEDALRDQCARHNAHFFACSSWNSRSTSVDFLGMKTDEGYSIAAWEEFSKTDEYKESVHSADVIEKPTVYSFFGNCNELSEPIKLEECEYETIEQARDYARYWLCNYKGYVLTSVDIYVGNEYKESVK